MRRLTLMGDAAIGGVRGPGWVRVEQHDDRWVAHLDRPRPRAGSNTAAG
jgi:hypothetical protein